MKYIKELNESQSDYYRLDKKTRGNELYIQKKNFDSMYNTINAGNDVPMDLLEKLIRALELIKNKCKKFPAGSEIPKEYQ